MKSALCIGLLLLLIPLSASANTLNYNFTGRVIPISTCPGPPELCAPKGFNVEFGDTISGTLYMDALGDPFNQHVTMTVNIGGLMFADNNVVARVVPHSETDPFQFFEAFAYNSFLDVHFGVVAYDFGAVCVLTSGGCSNMNSFGWGMDDFGFGSGSGNGGMGSPPFTQSFQVRQGGLDIGMEGTSNVDQRFYLTSTVNFSLVPIPEPSTYVLLASGIAGLIVIRLKSARASRLE